MMKPAIFLDHLYDIARVDRLSLDNALSRIHLLGFEALEVMYHPDDDPHALANRFYHGGMSVSCLCAIVDFANHPDDEATQRRILEYCLAYNTQRCLIVPGKIDLTQPDRSPVLIQHMIDATNRFCEKAAKWGITVVMEEFGSAAAPYHDAEGLAYFLDRLPGVKCGFDTGNFAFADEDALEVFDRFKDRIAHVHLKDFSSEPAAPDQKVFLSRSGRPLYGCPIGAGQVHNAEILDRLKDMNYDGMIVVEHHAATSPLAWVEQTAKWLMPRLG